MKRLIIYCAILTSILVNISEADFILSENDFLIVNSFHRKGSLWDSSKVDIIAGGKVGDGTSGSGLYSYNISTVNIVGGYVGGLSALDDSIINLIEGGVSSLFPEENSIVNIYGGNVSSLGMHGHKLNISGGIVTYLSVFSDGIVDISGGTISNHITTYNASTVYISGGSVSSLNANDSSTIIFSGYDFHATNGLSIIGNEVIGIGILSGKWSNGTAWSIPIITNNTEATIFVPEPCTLALLAIGGFGLRKSFKCNSISIL